MTCTITKNKRTLPSSLRKLLTLSLLLLVASAARGQFCTPVYDPGGNCSADDNIHSFTMTGANSTSISDLNTGCAANGFDDRTTVIPAIDFQQGGTYSGTLSTLYSSNENVRIWIDFNDDSTFSASESVGFFGPVGNGGSSASPAPNPFTISIPFTAPVASNLRMRVRLVYGNAPASNLDPCIYYYYGETHDYLVNILLTPPCAGTPTGGNVVPAGTVPVCNGAVMNLSNNGATFATGLAYEWEQSTNGGTTWVTAVGGTGVNTLNYTTAPITASIQYRLKVTCTSSSQSGYSTVVTFNPTAPSYAAIPYFQDFENWANYCTTNDVPSNNWNNTPATGDRSWRRDDQGGGVWTNTWGSYFPSSVSGDYSARWHSSALNMNDTGALDLYLDCSTVADPNKQLYFYFINPYSLGDSLGVWLSTNGGTSFSFVGGYDTAMEWSRKTLPIVSSSAQTIVRFRGRKYNWEYNDMGIDSVYVALPCTGTPVAGTVSPASPVAACPGGIVTLSASGTTMAGNLTFQWQSSTNGTTWVNAAGGSGATTTAYTTPVLSDTVYYRMIVTCGGSSLKDTTDPVVINVDQPVYGTLPYSESFESWLTRCETDDVPSANWTNMPATGNNSWRRDDQGSSANWWGTGGGYMPGGLLGDHSARFHSWDSWGEQGNLDLYVNCSPAGNKELQFFHINDNFGSDSLRVFLSTNGGVSFTQIGGYDTSNNGQWTLRMIPFTSTSATTVIRFQGESDYSRDIGIDAVRVLLPCAGTPNAGSVVQLTPCSGQNFNLQLSGNTLAAGLTYQWQDSLPGGSGSWNNLAGGTGQIVTWNITTPTYFRCIVTCSGSSDTTAASFFDLASFYYCYCSSFADNSSADDIGNFNISATSNGAVVLDNGVASPLSNNPDAVNTYTNYTGLTPDTLYLDTTYNFRVTQITSDSWISQDAAAVYIDFNHDGQFDPITEQAMFGFTNTSTQIANADFAIPDTAVVGLTGMRVILTQGTWQLPTPCGSYWTGETEDYLVYLSYPPCDGTPDAGNAWISDTLVCPGYTITLTDSAHTDKRAGLHWVWESASSASGPWTAIPGSDNLDTVNVVVSGDTYYRMRISCSFSGLESSSNVLFIRTKPNYQCYCLSYADGGAADVSDIGAFSIGTFVTNTGGAHLNNPTAIKRYTDWTVVTTALLSADTTYDVSAYHVMKIGAHNDAKVTLFIDFDNNNVYDVPQERIWTGYTTAGLPYITGTVTIPDNVVTGVFTGMRLIVNENINPNVPSDEACGTYTSGETEDYVVKFFPKGTSPTGVGNLGLLSDVALYPNPTSGRFNVVINAAAALKDLDLTISNLTGQKVAQYHYDQVGRRFTTEMDLGSQPRGVYVVELRAGNEVVVRKLIVR